MKKQIFDGSLKSPKILVRSASASVPKLQFTYPYASIKDVQATEEPSALKRDHPALQKIKFINCFQFLWVFLPSCIRIADTNPLNWLNPDPKHWIYRKRNSNMALTHYGHPHAITKRLLPRWTWRTDCKWYDIPSSSPQRVFIWLHQKPTWEKDFGHCSLFSVTVLLISNNLQ